ncbi:hypothetical protein HK405_008357, partial [Cladochytrium tenue]
MALQQRGSNGGRGGGRPSSFGRGMQMQPQYPQQHQQHQHQQHQPFQHQHQHQLLGLQAHPAQLQFHNQPPVTAGIRTSTYAAGGYHNAMDTSSAAHVHTADVANSLGPVPHYVQMPDSSTPASPYQTHPPRPFDAAAPAAPALNHAMPSPSALGPTPTAAASAVSAASAAAAAGAAYTVFPGLPVLPADLSWSRCDLPSYAWFEILVRASAVLSAAAASMPSPSGGFYGWNGPVGVVAPDGLWQLLRTALDNLAPYTPPVIGTPPSAIPQQQQQQQQQQQPLQMHQQRQQQHSPDHYTMDSGFANGYPAAAAAGTTAPASQTELPSPATHAFPAVPDPAAAASSAAPQHVAKTDQKPADRLGTTTTNANSTTSTTATTTMRHQTQRAAGPPAWGAAAAGSQQQQQQQQQAQANPSASAHYAKRPPPVPAAAQPTSAAPPPTQ